MFRLTDEPVVTTESSYTSSLLSFQDDNLTENPFSMFDAKHENLHNYYNIKVIKVQKSVRVCGEVCDIAQKNY